MARYEALSEELTRRIEEEERTGQYQKFAFDNGSALLRDAASVDARELVWRPVFARDIDRIMHCPYYNRYTDKTQVFSLIKNDDITRRSLHVQLVSRIARTIGRALHLNLELIEAIALGHDMGHTPFAHAGEIYLDGMFRKHAGRRFSHNIHSVRVLDQIFPLNLSLQTLSGIAGHNGEIELEEYWPVPVESFDEFDALIEKSYTDKAFANKIQPSTLEGNVVRIADIIAYLGKDRQDAIRMKMVAKNAFKDQEFSSVNSRIINDLVVNIIENSYGKPYIKLDKRHFEMLRLTKRDNYAMIYTNAATKAKLDSIIKPMMEEIYEQLLEDFRLGKKNSPIFGHHVDYVNQIVCDREIPYEKTEPNQMVVDYIASMTDDYFIDLHHYLFPNSSLKVEYTGYFDEEERKNV